MNRQTRHRSRSEEPSPAELRVVLVTVGCLGLQVATLLAATGVGYAVVMRRSSQRTASIPADRIPELPSGVHASWRSGCLEGWAMSCAVVADSLMRGKDVAQDLELAERLIELSCEADPKQCYMFSVLGEHLDGGEGGSRDLEGAIRVWERGCESGVGLACYSLGLKHHYGRDVSPDPSRAARYFERGCSRAGGQECCYMLGLYHQDGTSGEPNPETAMRYFRTACAGESRRGCEEAAALATDGVVPLDDVVVTRMLWLGCERGGAEACLALGDRYRDGVGVDVDEILAREAWDKSCQRKNEEACGRLAS